MKFKIVFLFLLLFVGLLGFLQQCKHAPFTKKKTTPPDSTLHVDSTICFERDILPLFENNCAKSGCHNSVTKLEGMQLDSYNGIRNAKDEGIKPGDPAGSNLYDAISSGFMNGNGGSPYGNLLPVQVALIKRWILEGAKDGTACPSKCDTTIFTYKGAIKKTVEDNCVACHNSVTASGGAAFDTYLGIKASITKGVFWDRLHAVGGSIMPPKGTLDNCKLKQIDKWIQSGFAE